MMIIYFIELGLCFIFKPFMVFVQKKARLRFLTPRAKLNYKLQNGKNGKQPDREK